MVRAHRGCLLIWNLPRHWADQPEETAETLQDILPAPVCKDICCIQVGPNQLHRALGGLLTHLYAKIWMTTDQLEPSVYGEITAIVLGGVSVACQLYGAYSQAWTPLYPTDARLRLLHEPIYSTGQSTGNGDRGDQLPTTITSMWSDTDIFQAHLAGGDRIVLTTWPYNQELPPQCNLPGAVQAGTIWDYAVMCRNQMWTAEAMYEHISDVHQRVASMPTNRWVGKHYRIATQQDRPAGKFPGHKAFIPTHVGQTLTGISPPLWLWEDDEKLAGSWCHLATTYIGLCHESTLHTNEVSTGLVQIATLGCTAGGHQ